MCGIVACSGTRNLQETIVEGLIKVQYRGYDSYGFACVGANSTLHSSRNLGALDRDAITLPDSQVLLGHSRWATHGAVSLENCHPHMDPQHQFALVHNGIIDNFQSLKLKLLARGTRFSSDTDSEAAVHIMAEALITHGADRTSAMGALDAALEGNNTLVLLFSDGEILALKRGSPLVIGMDTDNETVFLSSDALTFADHCSRFYPMQDGEIVSVRGKNLRLFRESHRLMKPDWREDYPDIGETGKAGFKHFMLKEIFQQWHTLSPQPTPGDKLYQRFIQCLREARQVFITGAGGAFFTATQIAWLLREISHIKAMSVPSYDIEAIASFVEQGDILLAISQSGETADTLQAIAYAQDIGLHTACLVNMPLSTMTDRCDFVFYNHVGPEECVLSTKSASAQIAFGYALAHNLIGENRQVTQQFDNASHLLSLQLTYSQTAPYQTIAGYLAKQQHLFVLGRKQHYVSAQICALNIKEASYLHAEAFSAGELKHGVIALLEPGLPVIIYMPQDDPYMSRVAAQVKARGAYVIAITDSDAPLPADVADCQLGLPADAAIFCAVIPGQLLAYYTAVAKGLDPDRPRNLAKSVTVL